MSLPIVRMTKLSEFDVQKIRFRDVQKDDKLYSVRFEDVVRVQTPVVTCMESITNAKGNVLPYLFIQPDKELATLLRNFDNFILDQAFEHRDTWFKDRPSRRELEDGFKRYLKEDNTFRLKIGEDLEVFDANKQPVKPDDLRGGDKVKLVMEVTRVSIGKSSYGTIWKCLQILRAKTKQCMIEDDDDVVDDDDDYEEFS